MLIQDILLLLKKITVGAMLFMVPATIVAGLLWFIQNVTK